MNCRVDEYLVMVPVKPTHSLNVNNYGKSLQCPNRRGYKLSAKMLSEWANSLTQKYVVSANARPVHRCRSVNAKCPFAQMSQHLPLPTNIRTNGCLDWCDMAMAATLTHDSRNFRQWLKIFKKLPKKDGSGIFDSDLNFLSGKRLWKFNFQCTSISLYYR